MNIRKIAENDVENFYNMMCRLDGETEFMMYEPGERRSRHQIAEPRQDRGDAALIVVQEFPPEPFRRKMPDQKGAAEDREPAEEHRRAAEKRGRRSVVLVFFSGGPVHDVEFSCEKLGERGQDQHRAGARDQHQTVKMEPWDLHISPSLCCKKRLRH